MLADRGGSTGDGGHSEFVDQEAAAPVAVVHRPGGRRTAGHSPDCWRCACSSGGPRSPAAQRRRALDRRGRVSEADEDLVVAPHDVLDGEADDPADRLGLSSRPAATLLRSGALGPGIMAETGLVLSTRPPRRCPASAGWSPACLLPAAPGGSPIPTGRPTPSGPVRRPGEQHRAHTGQMRHPDDRIRGGPGLSGRAHRPGGPRRSP